MHGKLWTMRLVGLLFLKDTQRPQSIFTFLSLNFFNVVKRERERGAQRVSERERETGGYMKNKVVSTAVGCGQA